MQYNILVVEDEESMRLLFTGILKKEGYLVDTASNAEEALQFLKNKNYHLVLTDLKMPGKSGLELLQEINESGEDVPVIMITAFGTIETAVEAMKYGAVDFLTKPLSSPEQLRIVVRKALGKVKLERENEALKTSTTGVDIDIVYEDPQMIKVIELVKKVAKTDATVLVTGESGTGKEVISRLIHNISGRSANPFVAVNCAALSETLLESELFGHEKGAFTGAAAKKLGRFELAHGSTLFLDEIGEINPQVQVKLLRVLEEKNFERVGGTKTINVDVRIIAATNRDLQKGVQENSFREDLFYRLNVFPIHIPPLRERKKDILKLAYHFLKKYNRDMGKEITGFSTEAEQVLLTYNWPGNIREMSNIIERAVIISSDDEIHEDDLLITPSINSVQPGEEGLLKQMERQVIAQALQDYEGNRKIAAQKLGISLRTLQYKIKDYGLTD